MSRSLLLLILVWASTAAGQEGNVWVLRGSNPLFSNYPEVDVPTGVPDIDPANPARIWNDPSVMKEGSTYKMWASLDRTSADPGEQPWWDASIYYLESSDGYSWTVMNGGLPVFTPGPHCDAIGARFDCQGVETPAVVKVGSTYHLYYSYYSTVKGHTTTCPKIGHVSASSETGFDSSTPQELDEITDVVCDDVQSEKWGYLGRAEPAPYHDGSQFILYFADVKCRQDNCQPPATEPFTKRGISRAVSTNGVDFTQDPATGPVLLQSSASYPPTEGWEGYSTPWVLKVGGTWHLFVDAFLRLYDLPVQRSLAHYSSSNGIDFTEVAQNIVLSDGQPWNYVEVRAPTVIADGGIFRMWFSGSSAGFLSPRLSPACPAFMMADPNCIVGIGYAQLESRPSVTIKTSTLKGGISIR